MAKNKTAKLSKSELDDLKEIGWTEDNPFSIPENISPVLKAKIIEAYSEQEGVENPATDLPDATYRQNQAVRERVEAEEDGEKVDTHRQGSVNK